MVTGIWNTDLRCLAVQFYRRPCKNRRLYRTAGPWKRGTANGTDAAFSVSTPTRSGQGDRVWRDEMMNSRLSGLIRRSTLAACMATGLVTGLGPGQAFAEEIGHVDTKFNWLGPDHKIVIEAFDDPKVEGVACHLSRAKTGGIKGLVGLAEDSSDASIACRQIGPIRIKDELEEGEQVFSERRSLIFKKLQVVRFFDKARNTLVYLTYSDRVIEGSPKNAISTVPIQPWPES